MAKPRVRIDWATGVSAAITVDVTNDLIGEIECWRGRSFTNPQYRSAGVGVAGHARFYLRNVNNKYTFDDDKLPIGRRVRIQLQVGATTWRTMWTGYIDTFDYQYRRQGYDRVEVSALGSISQLETATWTITSSSPDPRAYDVINTIVTGVTSLGVENTPDYNRSENRNLEPPGGAANEGSRDWSVRLDNFQIEEAPALQTIRDAATISFAHVYETASGRLRIDGLPSRQAKINGTSTLTFRDTSGDGIRVHSYDISLKTDRVVNAAAKSILDRFEEVDTSTRFVANGDGGKTLTTFNSTTRTDRLTIDVFRQGLPLEMPRAMRFWPLTGNTDAGERLYPEQNPMYYPGPVDRVYWFPSGSDPSPYYIPWPGGLVLHVHFEPKPYIFQDPDGMVDPVLITPDPYTETSAMDNNYDRTTRRYVTDGSYGTATTGSLQLRFPTYPSNTDSNAARLSLNRIGPEPSGGWQSYHAEMSRVMRVPSIFGHLDRRGEESIEPTDTRMIRLEWTITLDADAVSDTSWRWEMEYRPFAATASGAIIASNSTSVDRYGRRGYAVPGIFWGPDVLNQGQTGVLDIRSFVGYIVRDEFLGTPGYYGTIVVDLTRQFYPTTGATNPELDVGDKITLYQGTNSRDYLVSAIRYRFRQGEQLRAQIECAPARVM